MSVETVDALDHLRVSMLVSSAMVEMGVANANVVEENVNTSSSTHPIE